MIEFVESILNEKLVSAVPVNGGDINSCYRIETTKAVYFLKLNDAEKFAGMFEREAAGLKALAQTGEMNVPEVLKHGQWLQQQFLMLQWINSAAPQKDYWQKFGHALANMHRQTFPYFGWEEDNYIGSLVQMNAKKKDWHSFFVECRIMPLLQILADEEKFSADDVSKAINFCNAVKDVFPEEPPAMLHGDLWNGNIMPGADGYAVVYDPAVYYGHREMDIGMTKLFGRFPPEFYAAYEDAYPLAAGWQQRLSLTQLYPVLVHALLFGGHYISQAKDIMRQFI